MSVATPLVAHIVANDPPAIHSYLKSGTMLVYVEGYADDGTMLVEDCVTLKRGRIAPPNFKQWVLVTPSG